MSPGRRRLLSVVCGVVAPLMLVVMWLVTPAPVPPPPRPLVAPLPQHLLPQISLPEGHDPGSLAVRASLRNGERIYQRLCHHCHGRQGKGDGNEYMASVGHKPADHTDLAAMQQLSDEVFFRALRDGVKDKRGWLTMPPWESVLTPTDMWDVIAYVRRLAHTPPPSQERP